MTPSYILPDMRLPGLLSKAALLCLLAAPIRAVPTETASDPRVSATTPTLAPVPEEGDIPEVQRPEEIPPPPPLPDLLNLQPDPRGVIALKLDEALQKAWQDNPEVRAADARVRQAYWAYQGSDALPSTNVGVGSFQGGGIALANGNYLSEERGDYYVWLQQPFFPFGQLNARRKVAFRDLTQAQAAAKSTRLQLARRVKDAYYSVLANREQVRMAEQNLQLADQLLRIATKRLEVGAGPRLDQLNSTVQRNRAHQDLILAQSEAQQAETRLSILLGFSPATRLEVQGNLEPEPLQLLADALLQEARNHPRLQTAVEAWEQSRQNRLLAETNANPTPGISAAYDLLRPTYVIQLTLSIPLDWGSIRNDVRQKQEAEREKEQLLESEKQSLSSEILTSYQAYRSAYQNASTFREEVLKPAEESARITEYGYTKGAVPYYQLLTVQQQLASVRKEYIDRQLSTHTALNALEAAVGKQLEGAAKP